MSPINALVIGLGSIGQRHARVLRELGHGVTTVSRRGDGDYQSIAKAIAATGPGYVVVATETSAPCRSRFVNSPKLISADPFWWRSRFSRIPGQFRTIPLPVSSSAITYASIRSWPPLPSGSAGDRRSRSPPMSDRISATGGRDAITARPHRQPSRPEAACSGTSATNWIICYGCLVRGGESRRWAARPERDKSRWTITSTSCSR